MAFEQVDQKKKTTEVIEHLYSPVVEAISLLSNVIGTSQHELAKTDQEQLLNELSNESRNFISSWTNTIEWGFSPLFNFLLPCPYFYEIEQFNEAISDLKDVNFLYHFFSESITTSQLDELVKDPAKVSSFEETIWWDTKEKQEFIQDFIGNLTDYRNRLSTLLLEIAHSKTFKKTLADIPIIAEKTMFDLKSMSMEGLTLAQFVMGKSFKRTSLYKMYYFIPSYYFSPSRMRIFNANVCIVIYGCATPLSDTRETSAELEVQIKALSDRNRLLILRMLSGRKEYGAKIAEYLGITTATVSHHLEILKKAGLVTEEKVGTIKYFSYNQEQAESILNNVQQFLLPR